MLKSCMPAAATSSSVTDTWYCSCCTSSSVTVVDCTAASAAPTGAVLVLLKKCGPSLSGYDLQRSCRGQLQLAVASCSTTSCTSSSTNTCSINSTTICINSIVNIISNIYGVININRVYIITPTTNFIIMNGVNILGVYIYRWGVDNTTYTLWWGLLPRGS